MLKKPFAATGALFGMFLATAAAADNVAATVSGRVLDVKGRGVANAEVAAENQPPKTSTNSDGTFTLDRLRPGPVFLYVKAPSAAYLDGETRRAIVAESGKTVTGVEIILSGRPGDESTWVGKARCQGCHGGAWPAIFAAFDGGPAAAAHSRFVTEGTRSLAYPDLWPQPGKKFLPRDPRGKLLMVQDPLDGTGLVNLVLCTRDAKAGREYLFKFYPERTSGAALTENQIDCSDSPQNAVWIPVAATIGGQGNWGEGYLDPQHRKPDRRPNFGEGKQRYLARLQDVPFLKRWMEKNDVPLTRAKQDYVAFLPVYMVQDGTPAGSKMLGPNDVGVPKFWQKSPERWAVPENTLSRNCAGCHAAGLEIEYRDVPDETHPGKAVVTAFDYKDLNLSCENCHGPGSQHAASGDPMKLVMPQHLTARAGNESCGQCHGSHDGLSANPPGVFKYPYDSTRRNALGKGQFVPGVHALETFFFNYDRPSTQRKSDWKDGSFHSWPDRTHARSHSQMLPEILRSAHYNNPTRKLTCFDCHDAHTLDAGPASLTVDGFRFRNAAYGNNTLCLACHARHGDFRDITARDVAVLQHDAGRSVTHDGQPFAVTEGDGAVARNRVARVVARHMQTRAAMGGAPYMPDDPDMPSGNCASCHMPKLARLHDLDDDAQYHLAPDRQGRSGVARGNVSSHVFDIVWPAQSTILKNPDLAAGRDHDIMPNSCGPCHDFARTSGDRD